LNSHLALSNLSPSLFLQAAHNNMQPTKNAEQQKPATRSYQTVGIRLSNIK